MSQANNEDNGFKGPRQDINTFPLAKQALATKWITIDNQERNVRGRKVGEGEKDGDKGKRDFTSLHMFSLMELQLKVIPYGCLIEAKDQNCLLMAYYKKKKKGNQALGMIFFWLKECNPETGKRCK